MVTRSTKSFQSSPPWPAEESPTSTLMVTSGWARLVFFRKAVQLGIVVGNEDRQLLLGLARSGLRTDSRRAGKGLAVEILLLRLASRQQENSIPIRKHSAFLFIDNPPWRFF